MECLLSLTLLAPWLATASEPVSMQERAAAIVARKSQMPNRYHLKLRVENRTPLAKPPVETESRYTLHLWRDGTKIRVDQLEAQYAPPRPSYVPRSRQITCENCEREGYGIVTTVLHGTPPVQHMVEFKKLGSWNFDYYCTGFDWRYFGLANAGRCSLGHGGTAADFTKFAAKADVTTRIGMRDGTPCLIASRKTERFKGEWTLWLSEREEFNPIRWEQSFEVEGQPEDRSTDITWQQIAGGHMFPKRVKHNTMIRLGTEKMASEEVTIIEHADFTSPIDPSIFTVAGFGLNENQPIGYPGLKPAEQPRWKSGKVDYSGSIASEAPDHNAVAAPASAPYPVESNLSTTIGIIAGVLAVVTAVTAL